MKIFNIVFICLIIFGGISLQAQKKELKRGDNYFRKGEYYRALEEFKKAKVKGAEYDTSTLKKIGKCYFQLNDVNNAYQIFEGIVDKLEGEDLFIYAQIFHKLGGYSMAIDYYEKAKEGGVNPLKINELIASCKWAEKNGMILDNVRVTPTTIFTSGQSFGIQYYKDGVVYSSTPEQKGKKRKLDKQGKSFLSLFYSDLVDDQIQKGHLFSKDLVFPYHIGAISFTSDYNTMFYTRSVRVRGDSRLKIYKVEFDGQKWGKERELPFNDEDYDCATPAVSPDDKYLYFVSNKRGGYGSKDIYRVRILGANKFGRMENLGPEINTFGREEFPYISPDNELFFSSDGHYGFGGLDLFKAKEENGKWGSVENLLRPFNSEKDDFAYAINPNNKKRGFLSSNRRGDGVEDAIFFIEYKEDKPETESEDVVVNEQQKSEDTETTNDVVNPENLRDLPGFVSFKVKSSYQNIPAWDVKVDLTDLATGNVITSQLTDNSGYFNISIPEEYRNKGQRFKITFAKEGEFQTLSREVDINEIEDLNNQGITLTPIFNDNVLDEISGMTLYYVGMELTPESKKTVDRLVSYLKGNPNIVVKLNGHTQARGSKYRNLDASQKMAEKVKNMLVDKGVPDDSSIPRGYGERYLVNKCARGKYCDQKEHLKNRRIEVVVWKHKQ